MSAEKSFFRYIRGELLNGFYIRKLNLLANILASMSLVKAELLYWMNVQFTTDSETFPMRHRDIKGIGQVCGILSYIGLSGFLLGWFRFSETFMYGTKNRSERGLLSQESGELEYVRLEDDEYPTDISTIATGELPDAKRMSLIPDGTEVIGYIWGEDTEALLENGMINEDLLHATPPVGYEIDPVSGLWEWTLAPDPALIYAPWYGDKYMALAQSYPADVVLSDPLMLYTIEAHQKIKYNGLGMSYLFEITTAMVSDLIDDLEIELQEASSVWFYKMTFTRHDENFGNDDGWGRFSAWLYLIQSKFPFIQFNESGV